MVYNNVEVRVEKPEAGADSEVAVGARAVEGEAMIALLNWCFLPPGSILSLSCQNNHSVKYLHRGTARRRVNGNQPVTCFVRIVSLITFIYFPEL